MKEQLNEEMKEKTFLEMISFMRNIVLQPGDIEDNILTEQFFKRYDLSKFKKDAIFILNEKLKELKKMKN
jgi:hypothetical protein